MRSVNDLKGLKLRATDGEIGNVDQFYFDDETWTIRYLVVNAGSWLVGRMVLISPISLGKVDWSAGHLEVTLTRKQVDDRKIKGFAVVELQADEIKTSVGSNEFHCLLERGAAWCRRFNRIPGNALDPSDSRFAHTFDAQGRDFINSSATKLGVLVVGQNP